MFIIVIKKEMDSLVELIKNSKLTFRGLIRISFTERGSVMPSNGLISCKQNIYIYFPLTFYKMS